MKQLVILGCVRSGTTVLHELLLSACPDAVDLTDDDFESRYIWQEFGTKIGSRSTGTYCCPAQAEEVSTPEVARMARYIEERTRGGKVLITKNPHLLNKVPFVAKLLPEARFVTIIRDVMSTVASKKVGFQRANLQNEDHPPFVHYWPEDEFPCWWTLLNDDKGIDLTAGWWRRKAKGVLRELGLRKPSALTAPGKIYRHERLTSFLAKHPDLSRYYPGEGFARLPEAWLSLNAQACEALATLREGRWLTVNYSELVANARGTISRICDFAEVVPTCLDGIPAQLDESRAQKWRTNLSNEEQEIVVERMRNGGADDFRMLCDRFQRDLIGGDI